MTSVNAHGAGGPIPHLAVSDALSVIFSYEITQQGAFARSLSQGSEGVMGFGAYYDVKHMT